MGEDPKYHGVRMDIYLDEQEGEIFDIEPDRNGGKEDIKALPRRVRFYHAKIDAGNLESGEDYSHLRNVVVIFITSYDPFGRNRMVYTIQNKCVEEPDMPYADWCVEHFPVYERDRGQSAAGTTRAASLYGGLLRGERYCVRFA